jgi:hypothetical protein
MFFLTPRDPAAFVPACRLPQQPATPWTSRLRSCLPATPWTSRLRSYLPATPWTSRLPTWHLSNCDFSIAQICQRVCFRVFIKMAWKCSWLVVGARTSKLHKLARLVPTLNRFESEGTGLFVSSLHKVLVHTCVADPDQH